MADFNWNFKREEQQFSEIPEGRYRARINSAEMAVSKNGNDMLILKIEISGYPGRILWNYIVFLNDRPEITNRMLTQMFDSFGIDEGNFDISSYVGKAGGVNIKHDEEGRAKINYFLNKKSQEVLPPWEGSEFKEAPIEEDDLPF